MSGLGIGEFLNHNKDGGGVRRKFLNWKDSGKATVWLSTRAAIAYPSWNHSFMSIGTWEDKETGEERQALNFHRFVSPDAEIVHKSQYFRDDADRLKVPPHLDPFLLLREWLRLECDLPLDAVVFRWVNPKNGEVTEWRRGKLARLVDGGARDWAHSLDTKLDYIFVTISDDDPGEGAQLVRAPKLLGDKMKAAINQEIESNGDNDGNPMINPYAFRWIYDKSAPPMEKYRAFRYNKAELTDEIRAAITAPEFPDPEPDTKPRPGDKAKIRAAMEDAAQIDIPWNRIFVDAWEDDPTDFNYGANAKQSERVPDVETKSEPETKPEGKPRTRRKKAAQKPPEPKRIPCEDCNFMMLPTDTKCAQCGQEYDVDSDDDALADPPAQASGKQPASSDVCWSCKGAIENNRCTECGLDVQDDLPY